MRGFIHENVISTKIKDQLSVYADIVQQWQDIQRKSRDIKEEIHDKNLQRHTWNCENNVLQRCVAENFP